MRRMGSMFGVNAVFLTFAEFLDYIDQTIFFHFAAEDEESSGML